MDQMIRIDSQGFGHIHEEIRQFQRPGEGFLLQLTIVLQIQTEQIVHDLLEAHIHPIPLEDMIHHIHDHRGQGTHETHRILSGWTVDVCPAHAHTVLYQSEHML